MMAVQQKETLEKMYQVCNMMADSTGIREKLDLDDEIQFSDILKMDMLCYMAYLAAADGVISWKESRYIGELFDVNMTPEKLNKFIMDKNIYSTEFENNPPLMLQIMVAFDNAIYNSPVASDFEEELGDGLMKLYILMTKGLVEANDRTTDEMDPNEENDAQTYLGMIQNYIDENTEKHHTDIIIDYSKKTATNGRTGVKAPEKNMCGAKPVKAPRKRA